MTLTIEIQSPLAEKIVSTAELAGIPAEEHATRLLEIATEKLLDEKPTARPSKELIHSMMGKYAHAPRGSADFAREKRQEIEREERHFS